MLHVPELAGHGAEHARAPGIPGAGIKNILTKIHRSSNPMNVVKATFDGLSQLKKRAPREVPAPVTK
ncbi:MAG: hypothetical protein HQL18_05050 [Candidatus Omnitrophica bacterium]|nr:hypothetical protein [Candidatus Omnitrophota bacterium]